MTFWRSAPVCKLQGSIIILDDFTIRLVDDPGAPGEDSSDFVLTAGDSWPSVDSFLSDWTDQIVADTGQPFDLSVLTASGKIFFTTGTGNDYTITWDYAGDATEAERVRDWLGSTGNISVAGSNYTFPNAHKAGFYPTLPPRELSRAGTSYQRGQGAALDTTSWTQSSPARDDLGLVAVDLELQIDGSSDWAELWDLAQFFDDVFDEMGEPFAVINVPSDDTSGDYWGGFVANRPFEFFGERVEPGWDGLLSVAIRIEASHVPNVDG